VSRLKPLFLAPILFAILSCASDKSTDDTSDSNETGVQASFKYSEALLTHISATLPYFAWGEAVLLADPHKPDPCPNVAPTADDKGFIVTGDCTDLRGIIFTGRFLVGSTETDNRINYDFEEFSMINDALIMGMDGQIQINFESDTLTNNVAINLEDGSHNIVVHAAYTDHTLGPLADVIEVLRRRTGSFASLGTVEIENIDRFVLDGQFENGDECLLENDNTVLVFTGERGTLTFTESAKTCDGCTEWTDGLSGGQFCVP
jgi:hypothetical protein